MLKKSEIKTIYQEIQIDPCVLAILITGSYVYGTPNEKSDLDIRMIVNDKSCERAHWDDLWKYGVRIEAFYNTVETIEKFMEQARKKEMPHNVIHFWANGEIVYDPHKLASKLQKKAKKIWELEFK
jgi:predicted nucleotidyltransferase